MTEIEPIAPTPTPLLDRHEALGAKIIEFAGWLMPVQYAGILEEHRAVRWRPACSTCRTWASCRRGARGRRRPRRRARHRPAALAVGRAHYSMICAAGRRDLDDLIVYRLAEDRFLVVANASNATVVVGRAGRAARRVRAPCSTTASLATALVAVQGPRAVDILAPLTDVDLDALRYYGDRRGRRGRASTRTSPAPATRARTASSCSSTSDAAGEVWDALLEAGPAARASCRSASARATRSGSRPACRSTATSSTATTNPFEAGLGRVVKLDKAGRLRRPRGAREGRRGRRRRSGSSGSRCAGAGIARHGYPVLDRRPAPTGVVTSGTHVADARASRSRWPTSLPPMPNPVRCSPSRSAARRSPPRSCRCRSTSVPPDASPSAARRPRPADRAARGGTGQMVPADLRYTKDHEWVRVDGDEAVVGITAVRRGPAGRHRLRRAAGRRPERSTSSRRSASSSRSRPSATCSRRWPAR